MVSWETCFVKHLPGKMLVRRSGHQSPRSPSRTLPCRLGDRKEMNTNRAECLCFTRESSKEDLFFLSTTYHTITCRTNSSLLIPARVAKPTNHSEPTEHHSSYGLGCNMSDPRRVTYWSG